MPKKLNQADVAEHIADEFLDRVEHYLRSAEDSLDIDSLKRLEDGWTAASKSGRTSLCFDVMSGTKEPTFVIRALSIESTAGLPGKIHRLIAEVCDKYHMGMRYEAMEIPEHTKHFLQHDIGCVPSADGCLIRHPH